MQALLEKECLPSCSAPSDVAAVSYRSAGGQGRELFSGRTAGDGEVVLTDIQGENIYYVPYQFLLLHGSRCRVHWGYIICSFVICYHLLAFLALINLQ